MTISSTREALIWRASIMIAVPISFLVALFVADAIPDNEKEQVAETMMNVLYFLPVIAIVVCGAVLFLSMKQDTERASERNAHKGDF